MNKTVYFVRHGESMANVKGVIAGGKDDSPLTELGRAQTTQTAQSLKEIHFDLIVASPMSRTLDTAKIVMSKLAIDKEIITKSQFTERDAGEFTGKPKAEYFAFEAAGGEAGETTTDMQQRVKQGLDWLKEQDFENALVVTHNETVRMIRTVLEKLPAKDFAKMPQLGNGEFYKVDF